MQEPQFVERTTGRFSTLFCVLVKINKFNRHRGGQTAKHIQSMEYRYAFGCKRLNAFVGNAGTPLCRKVTTVGRFARTSLLFLFMLCSMVVSAQQVEVTLTDAGTLSEKIASDQKYSITSLKVSGPINGTDVNYLQEMAGWVVKGGTDGKLVDLDLADANIVEGGDRYYYSYSSSYCTKNDTIGDYMFVNCKLESIKLPNSVTSIGNYAFGWCSGLTSVTIPNSVTSIGYNAFYYCSSLTSVTIGNSVTSIGNRAFYGCSSLTSVTIGNSVEIIGDSAFKDCSALVKLVSLNTTPPFCGGNNALTGINKQRCTLYVPKNSLEAYKTAYPWKDFNNMEEIKDTGISLPNSNGSNKVVQRYDSNGRVTDKPTKGLNILKMSDGTMKKVMVK